MKFNAGWTSLIRVSVISSSVSVISQETGNWLGRKCEHDAADRAVSTFELNG